ncbi:MAG: tetratricopeptide repeat protein [Thermodesulfovibrionales bacterium]
MDASSLLKEAQILFIEGKDRESIEAFTKAINAGADPYIAFLGRGAAHLKLKEGENAIRDFSEAIKSNLKSARAYFFRGMAYLLGNEHEKAVEDFTRALELKSDYSMAKFSRSAAYAQLGKFEEASKDLTEVLPQMEVNLQSFADTYGIVRTQMWRVLAQLSGETPLSALKLNEKDIDTLKKWLSEE